MNKQRLLNAARAVREGRAEDFDMRWYTGDCGSPACVMGHYADRKDLQSAFVLDLSPGVGIVRPHTRDGSSACIDNKSVLQHFDIDLQESIELFSADGCGNAKTPEEAARYIEAFVARKEGGE